MDLIDKYNSQTIDEFMEQVNEVPWINKPKINKNGFSK